MSQLFYLPFQPILNSRGLPVGAAQVYFYATGTTTLQAVYADAGLTTPLQNPVLADAIGKLPNIYLPDDKVYRLRITDALGNQIGTDTDPYIPGAAFTIVPQLPQLQAPDGSAQIGFRAAAGAPAITRLLRDRVGEIVSVKDYVVGNGSTDDTAAYQALINLQPAEIQYPQGCSIAVTSKILWTGNMTHRFANNARIVGNHADWSVQGLGYPDLSAATVTAAIARDATSFAFTGTLGLAAGDDFYLYDTSNDNYDYNVVRQVIGSTVFTKRPIGWAFATAGTIKIYRLSNACRNVKVFGGEFRNSSTNLAAKGLGFLNATDIELHGTTVTLTGGQGIAFEGSMRFLAENVSAIQTGGVGLGARQSKDGRFINFKGRFPTRDELLTFYLNCSFIDVIGVDCEQYLNGEAPSGNAGLAGNCILVDTNCSNISLTTVRTRGSATYSVFVTNNCHDVSIDNFNLAVANLGGIRFGPGCNDNYAGRGRITDVLSVPDTEQAVVATTTGSISGTTLTVSSGAGIVAGLAVTGTGVTSGTVVVSGSGTTWTVNISQTVASTGISFYLPTAAIQDEAGSTGNVLEGGRQSFFNIVGGGNIRRRGTVPTISPYGAQAGSVADTSGATLTALETSVNSLKAALRSARLMAP